MGKTTHNTFCRFCHANCAMLADVEDGRVVAVRGDPDDPVFGGYTCIKGRQLVEAHYSPERLTSCQIRDEAGNFSPIATEATAARAEVIRSMTPVIVMVMRLSSMVLPL